ncbi:MAG: hypothetical protein JWL75_181 [Parcubacteria group bacterium]|nr:hypothetical protein [Parcubacteria group bacterium]
MILFTNTYSKSTRALVAGVLVLMVILPVIALRPMQADAQVGAGCGAVQAAGVAAGAAGGGAAVPAAAAAAVTGIPVSDAANLVVQTAVSTKSSTETTIRCVLDGLAWTVAKVTIQSLTRSTVNWINSGFSGSPAFVTDLRANLQNLGDAVADDFLKNLNKAVVIGTGFNIKTPFQDQLAAHLRDEYYRTTSSWGLNYTLPQQSTDPTAFLHGDFTKGGVSAFLSASQNPANNPFGAYELASNQLWAQVDQAAADRRAEIQQNKGFLSWRGGCATTPAATAPATTGTPTKNLLSSSTLASLQQGAAKESGTTLSTAEKCPFNAVRTPGSVIEAQLETQLGTGIRQLELANSINEIVGALIGQMVNKVLGAGGLIGTSQPSSGGGSSYLSQATDPSQYSGVGAGLADPVITSVANDKIAVTNYRDNWQKVLDAANTAQKTCGVRPDISTVITTATAGVAKGNLALTTITNTQNDLQTASQSTAANSIDLVTRALNNFETKYLSSSDVPNATQIKDAAYQASDTSLNSTPITSVLGTAPATTPTTPSLYTQMTAVARNCSNTATSGT